MEVAERNEGEEEKRKRKELIQFTDDKSKI